MCIMRQLLDKMYVLVIYTVMAIVPFVSSSASASIIPSITSITDSVSVAANFDAKCLSMLNRQYTIPGTSQVVVKRAEITTIDPYRASTPTKHCHLFIDALTVNPNNALDRSTIEISLRLPIGWNGRFAMGGGGAFNGVTEWPVNFMLTGIAASPLQAGYATASNDSGHKGQLIGSNILASVDGSWALDVPPSLGVDNQKEVNFIQNATKLATLSAKAVLTDFYEKAPGYSYFVGCSYGGYEGYNIVSKFPDLYDGVVISAPAVDFVHGAHIVYISKIQRALLNLKNPFSLAKINNITQYVLAKCDALDGVKDGILNNPTRCDFNPKVDLPKCSVGQNNDDCYTSDQMDFIAYMYSDTTTNINGGLLVAGHQPSSEALDIADAGRLASYTLTVNPELDQFITMSGWPSWHTNTTSITKTIDRDVRKYFILDDPAFDYDGFIKNATDEELTAGYQLFVNTIEPINYNLSQFKEKGGKVIFLHGWIDPGIPPGLTINLYNQVAAATAKNKKINDFARLYMVPGMGHCMLGPGPQVVDMLKVMSDWVELGKAPDSIIAEDLSKTMKRPLCPYPKEIVYQGGDSRDPASFACVEIKPVLRK